MDIEKAKKSLKSYLNWEEIQGFSKRPNDLAIETILSELDKKDKIIDLMARYFNFGISKCENCDEYFENEGYCKECIKSYFTNKVEEDIKE